MNKEKNILFLLILLNSLDNCQIVCLISFILKDNLFSNKNTFFGKVRKIEGCYAKAQISIV